MGRSLERLPRGGQARGDCRKRTSFGSFPALQAQNGLPMVAATGALQSAHGKEYVGMAAKVGGKGGGKFDLGQNAHMNVTPFVDVMLVLLIIFMVSIPAATVSIKLDLPPAI